MSFCFRTVLLMAILIGSTVRAQSPNAPADLQVSYTNDIRPIVKNFCTTCHAGENPEGEFVLTSYEAVRQYTEKGSLLKRINDADDPMPQNGLMPAYMRRLFQLWADGGYVNVGKRKAPQMNQQQYAEFTPKNIVPVDVDSKGFELLEYMQGHWIGSMNLMGTDFEWMAFDYRAIAPSHVHGIFEAGTAGNLFTSFFVAKFKGRTTIMARNGGLLNGIYRTSYFVLDQVKYGRDWAYYRLVDAHGGADIMWMDLTFRGDRLEFNAHTSRFGLTEPTPHMKFQGRRRHPELAQAAARAVGFPKRMVDFDFSQGLPKPSWTGEYPHTSASYITEEKGPSLAELGKIAKDPRRVDQMPFLSSLNVKISPSELIRGKKLHVYLSKDALTDPRGRFITAGGYIREDLLDTLLSFPELASRQREFTFTYLHPGDYFLTVVADMDGDGFPSPGDVTHKRRRISVKPESTTSVEISDLNVKN